MPIIVTNKYHDITIKGCIVVNVMRPNTLKNSNVLGVDGDRDTVISMFLTDLRAHYAAKDAVYTELMRLSALVHGGHTVVLECCCKPKPCHADVVERAINSIIAQNRITSYI